MGGAGNIPPYAVGGALVIVGALMVSNVAKIPWDRIGQVRRPPDATCDVFRMFVGYLQASSDIGDRDSLEFHQNCAGS